jgi:hypothetical protein
MAVALPEWVRLCGLAGSATLSRTLFAPLERAIFLKQTGLSWAIRENGLLLELWKGHSAGVLRAVCAATIRPLVYRQVRKLVLALPVDPNGYWPIFFEHTCASLVSNIITLPIDVVYFHMARPDTDYETPFHAFAAIGGQRGWKYFFSTWFLVLAAQLVHNSLFAYLYSKFRPPTYATYILLNLMGVVHYPLDTLHRRMIITGLPIGEMLSPMSRISGLYAGFGLAIIKALWLNSLTFALFTTITSKLSVIHLGY